MAAAPHPETLQRSASLDSHVFERLDQQARTEPSSAVSALQLSPPRYPFGENHDLNQDEGEAETKNKNYAAHSLHRQIHENHDESRRHPDQSDSRRQPPGIVGPGRGSAHSTVQRRTVLVHSSIHRSRFAAITAGSNNSGFAGIIV